MQGEVLEKNQLFSSGRNCLSDSISKWFACVSSA